MDAKVVNLAKKFLDSIFEPCKFCVYWESPELFGKISSGEAEILKRNWLTMVLNEWGNCGKLIFLGAKL